MTATSPIIPEASPSDACSTAPRGRHLEHAILLAVAYADIFDHPLTAGEIHRYLVKHRDSRRAVRAALGRMVPLRLARAGCYCTLPGRESLVEVRLRREAAAARLWRRAERYGRVFAAVPFVRMVAVTGSLSVNNTEHDSDIDFLFVTQPGRLWITRLMLMVIARAASRWGSRLCVNYVLSERTLELRDRTLYASHELAQMVPLSGASRYWRMRRANAWAEELLPNATSAPARARSLRAPMRARTIRVLRRLGERILRGRLGAWLERRERAIKIPMGRRQSDPCHETCFTPDEFKGHAAGHRRRTLDAWAERMRALKETGA